MDVSDLRGMFERVEVSDDPMAGVRAARERGVEPVLATGFDPGGSSTLVVAWFIKDTNEIVVEGIFQGEST